MLAKRNQLLALEKGLQIANGRNLYPLELETDSTEAINAILNGHEHSNLVSSCRWLILQGKTQSLKELSVRHNFREGNQIAHRLAKEASSKTLSHKLIMYPRPPVFLLEPLELDKNSTVFCVKIIKENVCNLLARLGNLSVFEDTMLCNMLS
ncbi:hypothetical protein RND71_012021 [Anisodus tanguticus]|uniref:RNase H type-1 domain-containing protein n=1 Tax=Anisodus tanguticus TaxID=243964 RepID=A0AAE1VPD4_9SOLA|nr:hypothetical protein RND71_012021 [Anisodus tanguticus]